VYPAAHGCLQAVLASKLVQLAGQPVPKAGEGAIGMPGQKAAAVGSGNMNKTLSAFHQVDSMNCFLWVNTQ
jgi:hypothetical protein